jgi:hypothetical protein
MLTDSDDGVGSFDGYACCHLRERCAQRFGLARCCGQDLKEITKESAQRAQRAEQLEGRLRKTDTKLSAARKEMADAVETVSNHVALGLLSPSRPPAELDWLQWCGGLMCVGLGCCENGS